MVASEFLRVPVVLISDVTYKRSDAGVTSAAVRLDTLVRKPHIFVGDAVGVVPGRRE